MKNRTGIAVLLIFLGAILGGAVVFFIKENHTEIVKVPEVKEIIKIRTKRDTVKVEKYIVKEIEKDTLQEEIEDTSMFVLDTLVKIDTSEQEEDVLTDRLIAKRRVKLKRLPVEDSTALLLRVDVKSYSDLITVEFWQSPLQLTGYELNKNRLKLFGFDPNQSILLEEKEDKGINAIIDNKVLVLHKTAKFTGIEE